MRIIEKLSKPPSEESGPEQKKERKPGFMEAIGAALLKNIAYQDKISPELSKAENEFHKRRGEKDPLAAKMKNTERKIYVHLDSIRRAIEAGGSEVELSVLDEIVDGNPDLGMPGINITKVGDIPNSYWESQAQISRDRDGYLGGITQIDKINLQKDIAERQQHSIESWLAYLRDESCTYPTWFKLYTLDGISKMGVYSSKKQLFAKRDRGTVAPYPHFDQRALDKVYDAIVSVYDPKSPDIEATDGAGRPDKNLIALIKSGNFNKLYSKFLLETRHIVDVPKNAEEVRGRWVEYGPGDEDRLAMAADGTPWCIASPQVASNYLDHGDSSSKRSYRKQGEENKNRFILLHLIDSTTGNESDTACASIRIGNDGKVAEISGLKDGQGLDDPLLQFVEKKVKELPGGSDFLEHFMQNRKIIAIDHKWQHGENLSEEEITFIEQCAHSEKDGRLSFLKEITSKKHGASIDLDAYIQSRYTPRDHIEAYLDGLVLHGASIDVVAQKLSYEQIIKNIDKLTSYGASIDIQEIATKIHPETMLEYLDSFASHGVSIDTLISRMEPRQIIDNLDRLIDEYHAKLDIDTLIDQANESSIQSNLRPLVHYGADINKITQKISPEAIAREINFLKRYGANIDISKLIEEADLQILDRTTIQQLLTNGANADEISAKLGRAKIQRHLDILIIHGANIDTLMSLASVDAYVISSTIISNLDAILANGGNINYLIEKLASWDICKNLEKLLSSGANVDTILESLDSEDIAENFDLLAAHGGNRSEMLKLAYDSEEE